MSKKSVVGHWGHRRTDLHIDEAGDKFTINTVQDAEPVSYTHLTLPTNREV